MTATVRRPKLEHEHRTVTVVVFLSLTYRFDRPEWLPVVKRWQKFRRWPRVNHAVSVTAEAASNLLESNAHKICQSRFSSEIVGELCGNSVASGQCSRRPVIGRSRLKPVISRTPKHVRQATDTKRSRDRVRQRERETERSVSTAELRLLRIVSTARTQLTPCECPRRQIEALATAVAAAANAALFEEATCSFKHTRLTWSAALRTPSPPLQAAASLFCVRSDRGLELRTNQPRCSSPIARRISTLN